MFDDDKVTAVTKEDILRLSGGGRYNAEKTLLNKNNSTIISNKSDP